MKKIILIAFSLLLLIGCNERDLLENNIMKNDNYFWLEQVKIEQCSSQIKEYYENQGRKAYFMYLDEIYVKRNGSKAITLKYQF